MLVVTEGCIQKGSQPCAAKLSKQMWKGTATVYGAGAVGQGLWPGALLGAACATSGTQLWAACSQGGPAVCWQYFPALMVGKGNARGEEGSAGCEHLLAQGEILPSRKKLN